ncbi:MAG TPA: HAMP domain-containing methyl-accepting chemotaxis protein [Spirochaetia bacterium]|nr:HAMP domain-containing methyl-accepting chemotaxis protein [Spirochaetia bacterium]
MSIRNKLLLLNLTVLVGFVTLIVVTYVSIGNIRRLNELTRDGLNAELDFQILTSYGTDLLVTANLEDALSTWVKQRDTFSKTLNQFVSSKLLQQLLTHDRKTEELESFAYTWQVTQGQIDETGKMIQELVTVHKKDTVIVTGLMSGYATYGDSKFVSAMSRVTTLSKALHETVMNGLTGIIGDVTASVAAAERRLVGLVLGLSLIVTIVSLAIFLFFARSMSRRLHRLGGSMETLKRRDFSVVLDVRGRDELGSMAQAILGFVGDFSSVITGVKTMGKEAALLKNEVSSAAVESAASITEMTANIGSIAHSIRDFVEHVNRSNEALRGISDSIDVLVTRVEAQSELIEHSTASAEQMNGSIGSVADIAAKQEAAARGLVMLTNTGGAMIGETNEMIRKIAEDIRQISEILGIINNIASQTNLLSMNAAIEAAHAGEAGRGFGVVAEEIRKLADSTNANSKQIKVMISGIWRKLDEVLTKSDKSRSAFVDVDQEVNSTSRAMSEAASATRELSVGSKEITDAMQRLLGIANTIREETRSMRENTAAVITGMQSMEGIGAMVKNGVEEIELGTKDVNTAMTHVIDLQTQIGDSIEKLNTEVSKFKTSDMPVDSDSD